MAPLPVINRPLPYENRLATREPRDIDLVVIHCTELPDLATARRLGEEIRYPESGSGNSGHFYIDRDGRIEQWVRPESVAHHVRGRNAHSLGIELVNQGRYPDWLHSGRQEMTEPYPDEQIEALIRLLQDLRHRLPALQLIAGHQDLDTARVPASDDASLTVSRKLDPGPLFPWHRVLDAVPLKRLFS